MSRMPPKMTPATYTRRVRLLKVGLPLLALGILSSLFLFSKSMTMDGALPFAEVDIEDRLREPKMVDVQIATTSVDGAGVKIVAQSILPSGTTGALARQANGEITTLSGDLTRVSAPLVAYDGKNATAALTGGVEILSAGYNMTTEALDLAIETAQMDSRGQVRAFGPLGQLDAGQMSLTQNPDGFVLVFKSGVHLLYKP